jgi:hypothetical protein
MPDNHPSPDSINPYQPGEEPAQRLDAGARSTTAREYRIRMEWGDRRRFMRSAGIYRILAVAGGVVGGYTLFLLLQGMIEAGRLGGWGTILEPQFALRTLLTVARGAFLLVQYYLYWKVAGAMIATAGGTTGTMREWSVQQWNLARVLLVTIAISLIIQGWDWLYFLLLKRGIIPNDL